MDYKKLYFHLMGSVANLVDSIDMMGDPPEKVLGCVRGWLVEAMREAEELYLQGAEDSQ